MSQEQVGNAVEAPESTGPPSFGADENFLEALEQSVNGGILDEQTQSTSENFDVNPSASPSEVQHNVGEDISTLK